MRKRGFRRIAVLLCMALCIQLSGCTQDLESEMNMANQTLPFYVDNIHWFSNCDDLERTSFVRQATQVPYGEIRYSPYAQKYFDGPFSTENILGFTASFAAMLPNNAPLDKKTIVSVYQAARKCFDEKGIPVYFSEVYALKYACFFVFASAAQIQEVTANDSVALYIGLCDYPEKSTLREFYGAEGERPESRKLYFGY